MRQCETNEECLAMPGALDKLRCMRICMSKVCYDELYSWNELEDGEIDVRLNSFKGCIISHNKF